MERTDVRYGKAFRWMGIVALAGCADRVSSGDAGRAPSVAGASADTISRAERRAAEGTIVFVSERDGAPQVYAIAPTGESERRISDGRLPAYPSAGAPDGRTVLATAVREEGGEHGEQVIAIPLAGGAARALGPASARARSASFTADGRGIVFESDRESFRDLYRADADGRGVRRLTSNREGNFDPAVSPDGRSIAFASSRDGDAEIYVMRADGSGARRLTAFYRDDWGPRWSPDGRTLAFLSNREGKDAIFLVSPDGTGLRRLDAVDRGDASDPAWSPDGTRIAYTLHVARDSSILRVVDVKANAGRTLPTPRGAAPPAWSPHRRRHAIAAGTGDDVDLWLVRADGTAATRLTRAPKPDWLPLWAK